jgi:hydrogenase/urease accessory protein HupE
MPNNQNMHRNVFFRDSVHVPIAPYSAIDSQHPEDLWAWMDAQRKAGNEVLAISHNANLSNGLMFPMEVDSKGRPIDAAWAADRMTNEPLTEIKQVKGTSETTPELSPTDEFAGFELMNYLIGLDNSHSKPHGSYAREAYRNGLSMQDTRGYNPYKFGFVGAGDSHNTATAYTQSNYFGDHGLTDGTPEARLAGKVMSGMTIIQTGTSGLAGVWAEENTRASIFDAMKRKETFGTSGVRIKVRMFGGWGYAPDDLNSKDWVKTGYAKGVPMGGDLPASKGQAPTFIVWAVKDPKDGNLDRIQIIKGWSKSGQSFEKIYDVVWSDNRQPDPQTGKLPPVGNTVDVKNASYTNTIGAVVLKKVWTDPEFDPKLNAFYYARVIQIPTPRWSTYDAKKLGVAPPAGRSCDPGWVLCHLSWPRSWHRTSAWPERATLQHRFCYGDRLFACTGNRYRDGAPVVLGTKITPCGGCLCGSGRILLYVEGHRMREATTRSRLPLAFFVVFAIAMEATPAEAHLNSTGMGPIYDGMMHFLMSPEDIIPVLALGLLAGLRGASYGRRALFVLPAAWFVGGILGSTTTTLSSGSGVLSAASFLLFGGLLALNAKLSLSITTVLAGLLGLYNGFLNGMGMSPIGLSTLVLLGLASAVFVLVALSAAFVVQLRAHWARTAVRVAGSWVAACGLLMLGWAYRNR